MWKLGLEIKWPHETFFFDFLLVFVCLIALPFLNTSEIRSSLFRPIHKKLVWLLLADCLLLGWIGMQPVESPYLEIGQIASVYFFVHFLVFIPLLGKLESHLVRIRQSI